MRGELHPIWAELRSPKLEQAYRAHAWSADRKRGALICVAGAAIYLGGFWMDSALPDGLGAWITAGRVLGMVVALGVAAMARRAAPSAGWTASLLAFAYTGSLVVAMERLAWGADDPLPGGFTSIFIGTAVVLFGFLPLRVRSMIPLAVWIVALPVIGMLAQGAPLESVFIGGQMVLGATVGSILTSALLHRERRRTWHGHQRLLEAHRYVEQLLDDNAAEVVALRRAADTDPLTGACNRRGGEALAAELRGQGVALSVLVVDLDFFKRVNDAWGHAGGDAALKHVVALMQGVSREGGDFVVRWGGDELVLVLADPSGEAGRSVAERLCALTRSTPAEFDGYPIHLTLSVGVATGDAPLEALVEEADRAVYAAKERGRDQAVHIDDLRPRRSAGAEVA